MSVICISHDRYFVDTFSTEIWELDNGLHMYGPGYGEYLDSKAARLVKERKEFDTMSRIYKKELAWMRKQPRARGTKAQARIDKFEALEEKLMVTKASTEIKGLQTSASRIGGKVVSMNSVTLRRGEKLILDKFSYEFEAGERVAIIGPNGAGKSSLIRAILGQIPIESGEIDVGETVNFGHFEQDGLDLPPDQRVMDYINQVSSLAGGGMHVGGGGAAAAGYEAQINATLDSLSFSAPLSSGKKEEVSPLAKMPPSQLLEQFGFTREQQHSYISTLSGGQCRRLQLLSLLITNPNFMILDEPGNDLDIATLSMLENLLDEYTGTLVMISHDRFMLDRLVTHLIVVDGDGNVSHVLGKFTDYLELQREELLAAKKAERKLKSSIDGANDWAPETPVTAAPNAPKKLTFKERKEYDKLEKEIAKAEARDAEISTLLADQAQSAGFEVLAEWTEEQSKLQAIIDNKGERWLALAERADIL
jgi:ABC transport system ATP-binding/permease protein